MVVDFCDSLNNTYLITCLIDQLREEETETELMSNMSKGQKKPKTIAIANPEKLPIKKRSMLH
jgi:hypothetical protein